MLHALRGDVFMANLEPVQGSEQGGARPIVVVSRDALNQFSPVIVDARSQMQPIRRNSIPAMSK